MLQVRKGRNSNKKVKIYPKVIKSSGCMPNIPPAETVLQMVCSQDYLAMQNAQVRKGIEEWFENADDSRRRRQTREEHAYVKLVYNATFVPTMIRRSIRITFYLCNSFQSVLKPEKQHWKKPIRIETCDTTLTKLKQVCVRWAITDLQSDQILLCLYFYPRLYRERRMKNKYWSW